MQAIYAKRKRNEKTNQQTLETVFVSVTRDGALCKHDGVFLGNTVNTKARRLEHARTIVTDLGRKCDEPLTESAIADAYKRACQEVNLPIDTANAITELDFALRVLEEIEDHIVDVDIEWSVDIISDTPSDKSPVRTASMAVHSALKLMILGHKWKYTSDLEAVGVPAAGAVAAATQEADAANKDPQDARAKDEVCS